MSIFKKITAILVTVAITLGIALPCSFANSPADYIFSDEKASMSTVDFIEGFSKVNDFFRTFTGKDLIKKSSIDINFKNSVATELCDYLRDNSGLDIVYLLKNIPLNTENLERFYEITDLDVAKLRDRIKELRHTSDKKGLGLGAVLYFLENYLSVIRSIDVYTVPNGEDQQVVIAVHRMDGTVETMYADIYFSPDGVAHGSDGNGILDLGFECSVYDLFIYATTDCWMRDFGFCLFYDIFCYTTPFFNYITRRFKFEYGDKEWMVQIWKGNYISANGAEVGLYNRDKGSFGSYYDCCEDLTDMTLKLSYKDNVIFDIEGSHWWMNGFKLSKTLYNPNALTMEFSIKLQDEEMANALAQAINNHYRHDVRCTIEGNTIKAIW